MALGQRRNAHRLREMLENSMEANKSTSSSAQPPACFRMIYESRDGKFCLFETDDGHLLAVDSAKLT